MSNNHTPTIRELELLARKIHPKAKIERTMFDDPSNPPTGYHLRVRVQRRILVDWWVRREGPFQDQQREVHLGVLASLKGILSQSP